MMGLKRLAGEPCRDPPPGALDQFLDQRRYCITLVACEALHFGPGCGVEHEPHAHFLAIDTKMTFTVASLLFGIRKGHGNGSGCGYTITFTQSENNYVMGLPSDCAGVGTIRGRVEQDGRSRRLVACSASVKARL
jgi:hypothetical protein